MVMKNRLLIRVFAIILVLIPIIGACIYEPFRDFFTFFSNWAMLFSFAWIVLLTCFAAQREPSLGKHAMLHVLFEFALTLNLVTVIVYWGMIHHKVIDQYEGGRRLNMYFVHIFPAVGIWLTRQTIELYLNPGHWKIFIPIGIVYVYINYLETKK